MRTLRVNNSRILIMIKNAKFSGYYFDMNLNIWGDFQICISVPLSLFDIITGICSLYFRLQSMFYVYII